MIRDTNLVKTDFECPLSGGIDVPVALFTASTVGQGDKATSAMTKFHHPTICLE